jgi:hypothetical protein
MKGLTERLLVAAGILLVAGTATARPAEVALWTPSRTDTIKIAPSPEATAAPDPATATATTGNAWLSGDRLLVTGAALDLFSKRDATRSAVKDAADRAAEFLERQGWEPSAMEIQGIEDSLLRETPLRGKDLGDVRIEGAYQERWVDEGGDDRWSVHVTLSLRLGKKRKQP